MIICPAWIRTVSFISILLIAFAMSTDAFAVAVGKGISAQDHRFSHALKTGLLFGVIEGITPVIGWLLGLGTSRFISEWDHWIAFTVLSLLGLRMCWAGFNEEVCEVESDTPAVAQPIWMLCLSAVATSIDALAVGVSLAFVQVNIAVAAVAIGCATTIMVTIGMLLGKKLGCVIGQRAEAVGGIVLIIIGSVILYEHLSGSA